MAIDKKITIGLLILTLLIGGVIYIQFDNLKLRVDEDKSTFYVKDGGYWKVAGREYNKLQEGTSNLNRDVEGITIETIYDDNSVTITRTTPYKRGPVIKDIYYFEGDIKDVELFPISHTVQIYNATGLYYIYEVKDLNYDGETRKLNGKETSAKFGYKMQVDWWKDYRLGWIYKNGNMYVKSEKIETDFIQFNVRLFDPIDANQTNLWNDVQHVYSADGQSLLDSKGDNNLTKGGSVDFTTNSKFGDYAFNCTGGSGDYFQTLKLMQYDTNVHNFSSSIWVNMNYPGSGGDTIFGNFDISLGYRGFELQNVDYMPQAWVRRGSTAQDRIWNGAMMNNGEWINIITFFSYDGTMKIYLNGTDSGSTYNLNTLDSGESIASLALMRFCNREDGSTPINMIFDEAYFWNRTLTNGEIAWLQTNQLTAPGPSDTCTYSSGDWVVTCSDNCTITADQNLGANNLILNGAGTFISNGQITLQNLTAEASCNIITNSSIIFG